jgi:hypothetical protein
MYFSLRKWQKTINIGQVGCRRPETYKFSLLLKMQANLFMPIKKIIHKFFNDRNRLVSLKIPWHFLGLTTICLIFLAFGVNHLGQFITVDEEKWLYVRIPQLYRAIVEGNWEGTLINDKPGLLPSFLAGIINFFANQKTYNSLEIENYLFWWRFPVLAFNCLMLALIYWYISRLLNKTSALISTAIIGTSPVIIGISQIVNPDSTLWSTSTVTILIFLTYLKSGKKRYVFYCSGFFGLALISKFNATYFYPAFYMLLYLSYIIGVVDKEQLKERCFGYFAIVFLSTAVYFLLFPATWAKPGGFW